jgi:protocatechuate 3,4-dioxygenase beta subunit
MRIQPTHHPSVAPVLLAFLAFLAFLATASAFAAAPTKPLTVSGRVLAPTNQPLADVLVELGPLDDSHTAALRDLTADPWRPIASTTTRPDGRFELTAPEPGMWRLRLSRDGHVPLGQRLVPLVEPTTLDDAVLERDGGFLVTVLDAEGRPLAGVSVQATRSLHLPHWRLGNGGWTPVWRRGTTDEQGRVRLARRDGEGFALAAWAPGWQESVTQSEEGAGSATLRLTPGVERTLRVGHGEEAVGGVVVRFGEGRWPVARTGDDGTARVVVAAEGPTMLGFDAGGGWALAAAPYAWPPRPTPETPAEEGEPPPVLDVELPSPWIAAGQVTAADHGGPLAGALVWPHDEPARFVRADARGAFRLVRVEREAVRVGAAAPGYRSGEQRVAPRQREAALFVLDPNAAVAGTLVDFEGRPVAGAEVWLRRDQGAWQPWPAEEGWQPGDRSLRRTWSDAAGRFRFRGREAGERLELRASAPGLAPAVELVTAGGAPVEVVLGEGRAVRGRVVGEEGQPVAGASVGLVWLPPTRTLTTVFVDGRRIYDHQTRTDGEGAFLLADLPPGRYDVIVDARPAWAVRELASVELPEDRGTDLGEVALEAAVALDLQVVDADGDPVEDAQVEHTAHRRRGGGGSRSESVMTSNTGRGGRSSTDAEGRYRLEGLAPGVPLDLQVVKTGWLPAQLSQVVPPLEDELVVVLDRGLTLHGRVLADDGRPASGASVGLTQRWAIDHSSGSSSQMTSTETRADDDGLFRFEGLRPTQRVELSATWEGLSGAVVVEDLPQRGAPPAIEIRLIPAPRVVGTVNDGEGRPVAGARVEVLEPGGGGGGRSGPHAVAITDALGRFDLVARAAGPARVAATHQGLSAEREVVLAPGTTTVDLRLDLPEGRWLRGRILDAEGNPVPRASLSVVCVERCREGGFSSSSGVEGEFLVADLVAGVYRVEATLPGFAAARRDGVDLTRGPVDGLELVLRRGGVVEGALGGADRAVLAATSVSAVHEDGGPAFSGTIDHRGHYLIGGLGPGRWYVTAASPATGHRASGEVDLGDGRDAARLDLELEVVGVALTGRVSVDRRPASGVDLWLVPLDGGSAGGIGTRTAFDGGFRFAGLDRGRYRLEVRPSFDVPAAAREVDLHGDDEVDFHLTAAAVSGTVVAPAGVSLSGLRAVLTAPDTRRLAADVDPEGRFRLTPVTAGPYVLTIERNEAVLATQPLEVGPQDLAGLVLVLD